MVSETLKLEQAVARIVATSLQDSIGLEVVVTPLLLDMGGDWYFIIATCGPGGFRSDGVFIGDERDEALRAACLLEIARTWGPRVIYDCGSELEAVRWCSVLWPGDRTARLRAKVEEELNRAVN